MPTILTFTIKPSGGDFTSMTACRAANAKNLVTADEQHIYEFSIFSGGLDDNDAFSGYTDDATRNVILRSASSDVWDGIDPTSGFYFNTTVSTTLRPVSGLQNMELDGICWADGSVGALSVANGGDFKSIDNCAFKDITGDNLPNGISGSINNVLIINPGDDGGVISSSSANKITVVNSSNRGIVSVSGSAVTNSFCFGSTGVDFSNQGGTHSNNATEDTTAAGSNPEINRTSADFANFAGDDFRTASGSDLATAGTVDFIGYALEPSIGGVSIPVIMHSYRLRRA